MKTLLSICLLLSTQLITGQNINIPDANFKAALIESGVDLNNDGEISEAEALEVGRIIVANKEINSLVGIEHFKNVTWLDIKANNLTTLDLRETTKVQNLYMANNQVSQLLISGLQNLSGISAANNNLSSIELRDLPRMVNLYINNNPISSVDISQLPELQRINTSNTQIASLDFTNNPKMFSITVNGSDITELDLTGLCNLSSVNIRSTTIKDLDLTDCRNINSVLCAGSELEQLYLKNEKAEGNLELRNLDNLQLICADEDELSSINQLMTELNYTNVDVNSNCDGPAAIVTYYRDQDNDGYGDDATASTACIQANNMITRGGDCNDNDATIYPGASELCDGKDNNCNSDIDEGLTYVTYYEDLDNDGYGNDNQVMESCSPIAGMAQLGGDCNDNDATINPAAAEIPNNNIDENCDGALGTSSTNDLSENNLNFYPNPTTHSLFLTNSAGDERVEVTIYSLQGQQIYNRSVRVNKDPSAIDLGNLTEGIYILQLNSKSVVYSERLVILLAV